ncbi:MAG: GNAT family N-acetyltransferase [Marinibacterium sp.]|nr:GNAT family N-acetyltransferase [Marinibacterium sp.]
MTLRPARDADRPAMERFLAQHAETSMFLRSNLATHGVVARDDTHRDATRFWLSEGPDLRGVFGVTRAGYLLMQAPDPVPADLRAWADALGDQALLGITGVPAQIDAALEVLGWPRSVMSLRQDEPLYRLALADLTDPGADLRPPGPQDAALLTGWFDGYLRQTGMAGDAAERLRQARARAQAAVAEGSPVRMIYEAGQPVAMAALNAQVGDMVQVGGVFVPDDQRNRGQGRRVTAALLAEARRHGASVAILFANNRAAARAYEGIGFRHIGSYGLALLDGPRPASPQPPTTEIQA